MSSEAAATGAAFNECGSHLLTPRCERERRRFLRLSVQQRRRICLNVTFTDELVSEVLNVIAETLICGTNGRKTVTFRVRLTSTIGNNAFKEASIKIRK